MASIPYGIMVAAIVRHLAGVRPSNAATFFVDACLRRDYVSEKSLRGTLLFVTDRGVAGVTVCGMRAIVRRWSLAAIILSPMHKP